MVQYTGHSMGEVMLEYADLPIANQDLASRLFVQDGVASIDTFLSNYFAERRLLSQASGGYTFVNDRQMAARRASILLCLRACTEEHVAFRRHF